MIERPAVIAWEPNDWVVVQTKLLEGRRQVANRLVQCGDHSLVRAPAACGDVVRRTGVVVEVGVARRYFHRPVDGLEGQVEEEFNEDEEAEEEDSDVEADVNMDAIL